MWDGMLPSHNCRKCGKPLDSKNRPAELYLGTYTGLCYDCQNSGSWIAQEFSDGARVLCYPPHCPSWRRDREHYISYPDCPECKGKGMKIISRANSLGGDYPHYCKTCSNRFCEAHPNEGYKIFCNCGGDK